MATTHLPPDVEARAEDAFERFGTRKPRCSVPGCAGDRLAALTGTTATSDLLRGPLHGSRGARQSSVNILPDVRSTPTWRFPWLVTDHRVMDDRKADWPPQTRLNPDGSPALQAAAYVRTVCDWLVMIVGLAAGPGRAWLEALEERMTRAPRTALVGGRRPARPARSSGV